MLAGCYAVLNGLFDAFFSILVVNNLSIFIWRIIWDTQDLYLTETNVYFNSLVSLLIAYSLIVIIKCIQINELNINFHKTSLIESEPIQSANVKLKLFLLLISAANINHWRCLWNFTYEYTNKSEQGLFAIGLIAALVLLSMRRLCNVVSSPFQLSQDDYNAAYRIHPTSANHYYYLSLSNSLSQNVNQIFIISIHLS